MTRHARGGRRPRRPLALGLVLALGVAGCGGPEAPQPFEAIRPTSGALEEAGGGGVLGGVREVLAPQVGAGLEVVGWSGAVDTPTLVGALRPFLEGPGPVDEATADRWRRAGIRLVAMPAEAVRPLRERMRGRELTSRWLGEPRVWTGVVEGPETAGGSYGDGQTGVRLEGGHFRLLCRGWITARPVLDSAGGGVSAAELRLELVPQHVQRGDPARRLGLIGVGEGSIGGALDDGLVFRGLWAGVSLPRGLALVLIPSEPGTPWEELLEEGEADPERRDTAPAPALDALALTEAAGPGVPGPRPLGGPMLATDLGAAETGHGPRTIVALIAHAPERFGLLPGRGGGR